MRIIDAIKYCALERLDFEQVPIESLTIEKTNPKV